MAGIIEIADQIREEAGITQVQAQAAVKATLAAIKKECDAGGKCMFMGFGTFSTKIKEAHEARNPMDNTTVKVPKKSKLVLKTQSILVAETKKAASGKKK
jgi:DNA-binding protein HU-beta